MCGNFGLVVLTATGGESHGQIHGDGKAQCNCSLPSFVEEPTLFVSDGDGINPDSNGLRDAVILVPTGDARLSASGSPNGTAVKRGDSTFSSAERFECQSSQDPLEGILNPADFLEAQTARTELRGGQAGGFSTFEYKARKPGSSKSQPVEVSIHHVKRLARKRHPLAQDLRKAYDSSRGLRLPSLVGSSSTWATPCTITALGHTRFATASANVEKELHPHQWVPPHQEPVWAVNTTTGQWERSLRTVVLHTSHNGDFDSLDSYQQEMSVGDVGLWLERVLHCRNDTRGDSPKLAGCLDLLRVQGRWGPAARLAWIRCVATSAKDVSGGQPLSKEAPNTAPKPQIWDAWSEFLEDIWTQHLDSVVEIIPFYAGDGATERLHYRISSIGESHLVKAIELAFADDTVQDRLGVRGWSKELLKGVAHFSVRGFLRADLYESMTELLVRARGSFGLQAHCTLEPGVVVIGSKGQPMSIAFDQNRPIALFASEPEALSVPIDISGARLGLRFDLDSHGEIVRIGNPRSLVEGTYLKGERPAYEHSHDHNPEGHGHSHVPHRKSQDPPASPNMLNLPLPTRAVSQTISEVSQSLPVLATELDCGMEIRCYSLETSSELRSSGLFKRCIPIRPNTTSNTETGSDLVARDLVDIPAVLASIDRAWKESQHSVAAGAETLSQSLIEATWERAAERGDGYDLVVAGIENSLWIAEQWVSDLRRTWPGLNATAVSANKLLHLMTSPSDRVFFPGSPSALDRRIDPRTCILLVSHSGQTFGTLQVAQLLANKTEKLWAVVGIPDSKIEILIAESHDVHGKGYKQDRIISTLAGARPAEPASISVAATWHTFTHLMLYIVAAFNEAELPSPSTSPSETCLDDMFSLTLGAAKTTSAIVGVEPKADLQHEPTTHDQLVAKGRMWAEHINEPWRVLVLAGAWILFSVTLGVPLFGTTATVLASIGNKIANPGTGQETFVPTISLRDPISSFSQPLGTIAAAFLFQILDALFFVFIAKIFTWILRLAAGRPLWARMGKRTLVIVDTPALHQLLENYVSKLFSQAYSFSSIDVHGASGLDHFVHRFSHRVSRGLLLAVGRPDGRLLALSRAESTVLLSAKQAAFITNTAYAAHGSGPEILSITHSPFIPQLGADSHQVTIARNTLPTRRQFIDEYLFDRLSGAPHPHASAILHDLLRSSRSFASDSLPYGAQLIEPDTSSGLPSFVNIAREMLSNQARHPSSSPELMPVETTDDGTSADPSARIAFLSRLDAKTRGIVDKLAGIEQFYESRIAALERFVAFCVIFHAMAEASCKPWLRVPWDISRSQSYLRIATTASPVGVVAMLPHEHQTLETKARAQKISYMFRKFRVHF